PFAFSPFLLLLTSPPEFSTLSLHDALPILRDLSQQGCYLDADNPLPLGTTVHVRMMKGGRSLEVQGRVVYNQPGKGMGLMFTAVKPEHGGTLDVWINESRETSWLANNRRRSQRVLMKVPVRVSVQAGA